ncbi:MAG: hypothetical protein JW929_10435 [Anaerolineales bacterium]|nr:hypothetical protein [Anaerolineales bacterium]
MRGNKVSGFRLGRIAGWIFLAAVGALAALYFLDPTRRAALTGTAGWFLRALRFLLGK